MQHFTRSPIGQEGDGAEAPEAEADSQEGTATSSASPSPSQPPKKNAGAVGNAMKALFESSDVSIRRGDETRVMSRAQEALAELQRRSNPPAPVQSQPPVGEAPRSVPPGPRVDKGLWIVLALGLLAIAGSMIAYGL